MPLLILSAAPQFDVEERQEVSSSAQPTVALSRVAAYLRAVILSRRACALYGGRTQRTSTAGARAVFAPATAAAASQSTATAATAAAQSQERAAAAADAGLDSSSSGAPTSAAAVSQAGAAGSSAKPAATTTTAGGAATATGSASAGIVGLDGATAATAAGAGASQGGTTPLLQRGNTVSSAVGFGGVMRVPTVSGASLWTDIGAANDSAGSASSTAHRGGLLGVLHALVRRLRGSTAAEDGSEEVCACSHYCYVTDKVNSVGVYAFDRKTNCYYSAGSKVHVFAILVVTVDQQHAQAAAPQYIARAIFLISDCDC
jgi:hypothetical protein